MRYVLDFMPMLMLLSIFGYYQAHTSAQARGREGYIAAAGILTAGLSMTMSILLGISGNIQLLQKTNPAMLNWLIKILG
jgi:hypothetical protein